MSTRNEVEGKTGYAIAYPVAVRGTVSYADWQAQLVIRPPYALSPTRTENMPRREIPARTPGAITFGLQCPERRADYAASSTPDKPRRYRIARLCRLHLDEKRV